MARFYAKNTQTEANTGGTGQGGRYDLSLTQGTSTTLVADANNNATPVLVQAFHITVDDTVSGTSFPVSFEVTSIVDTGTWYMVVARYDSGGTVQASSAPGAEQTTATTYTGTLNLSTTWATGDQLVLEFWGYRGGGHSAPSFTIGVNRSTTYVDATVSANVNVTAQLGTATVAPQNATVSFTDDVNITAGAASATLTGYTPVLSRTLSMEFASLSVSGLGATVSATENIPITAQTASVTSAPQDATVTATDNKTVVAELAAATASGSSPTLLLSIPLAVASISVTPQDATVNTDASVTVDAELASLSVSGLTATVQNPVLVQAGLLGVFLAHYDASVITTKSFSVYPDATVSFSGVVNELGNTTNLYASVDDSPGSPDEDTTYLVNSADADGSVMFELLNVPADFGVLNSVNLRLRVRQEA